MNPQILIKRWNNGLILFDLPVALKLYGMLLKNDYSMELYFEKCISNTEVHVV
jgi:hypothetical protein